MGKGSKFEDQYGPIADQMAQKYGLDPRLFRNQIRQESGFNPHARSGVGAVGMGQFMPGTAKAYGYSTDQLVQDPKLALELAAKHMRKLTDTYGDQRLALAAYNGGGGSVDFVKQKLGKKQITYEDWVRFNEDRRKQLGNSPTAWHGQTLDYVKIIANNHQQPQAPKTPSKVEPPISTPTPVNTPQIMAQNPQGFDYYETLAKQRQGNPEIPTVPQSATQVPLMSSGQPDPTYDRMHQIEAEYAKLMAQRQAMNQPKPKTEPKRDVSQLLMGLAQAIPSVHQAPVHLEGVQQTEADPVIQHNYNTGFGTFIS